MFPKYAIINNTERIIIMTVNSIAIDDARFWFVSFMVFDFLLLLNYNKRSTVFHSLIFIVDVYIDCNNF